MTRGMAEYAASIASGPLQRQQLLKSIRILFRDAALQKFF
jgi:hypothetical protein